jgi:hypothetical protein
MSELNFIPDSYYRAQRRRGRRVRQGLLLLAVAAGLCVAGVGMKGRSLAQLETAERLEEVLDTEQGSLGVLAMLQREKQELVQQVDLHRDLVPTVSYADVIAAVNHALPDEIAMTELVLRSVRPDPEPRAAADTTTATRRGGQAEETQDHEPNLIGLELLGLAPDDLAIARLVSNLHEDPLFSRIKMRSSRALTVGPIRAREFSLTLTVDLDRRIEWIDSPAEVAHAD